MRYLVSAALLISISAAACSPTVRVEPPEKPITINLNVKIDHQVRVQVEKDLDRVISEESGLF